MTFISPLILLLCATLFSMENDKPIVPRFSNPNLLLLEILKMVGDCEEMSLTNKKWYEICQKNYSELRKFCPWRFVKPHEDFKYKMKQGLFPGLAMVHVLSPTQIDIGFILNVEKTVVSFHFGNRDYALKLIRPAGLRPRGGLCLEFLYETYDEGELDKLYDKVMNSDRVFIHAHQCH
jgi:hypothetical protein